MVVPVHPPLGCHLNSFAALPGLAVNRFCFIKTIDGFGQSVFVAIALTADRRSFTQLAVLALQGLDVLALFAGLTGTLSNIGLLATNLTMQSLRGTTKLRGNSLNGRPLGWIVVQVLQNHAHGTFTDFRGVGRGLLHNLITS